MMSAFGVDHGISKSLHNPGGHSKEALRLSRYGAKAMGFKPEQPYGNPHSFKDRAVDAVLNTRRALKPASRKHEVDINDAVATRKINRLGNPANKMRTGKVRPDAEDINNVDLRANTATGAVNDPWRTRRA